ncbi:MAG: DUF1573 domain-containing protein [Spirosomataceae bacterium]
MKKFFAIAIAFVAFTSASYAQGVLKFKNEKHDFGKVPQNVPAVYSFEFTNTGSAPIVISNAQPSCGCTTPDWTKEPVMPGKTGFVKASYNAASMGPFTKTVTVTSNAETPTIVLTITGEVVSKEDAAAAATKSAAKKPGGK